jgi:hypothetical protein
MSRVLARGALYALTLLVLTGITAGTQAGGSKKVFKTPQEAFEAIPKRFSRRRKTKRLT